MTNNRVREIRKQRKLTLEELAQKLGVSYSAVQKVEVGTADLDTKWMRKLAEVLQVKPYELLPPDMQPPAMAQEKDIIEEVITMVLTHIIKNNLAFSPQIIGKLVVYLLEQSKSRPVNDNYVSEVVNIFYQAKQVM